MKKYDIALLDWDGCLAKTLDLWLYAYKEVFLKYGLQLDDKTISQQVFGDWQAALKMGISDNDGFNKEVLILIDENYPKVQLYPHALEMLKEFRAKNKKMALLTSSKREIVLPALENNNIEGYFDLILAADDVSKHKPDPEIVDKSLEMLSGTKDQAIIIGDSKSDLGAAQNSGIDSILYYPKENEKFYDLASLKVFNPTFIIRDFGEVSNIIK